MTATFLHTFLKALLRSGRKLILFRRKTGRGNVSSALRYLTFRVFKNCIYETGEDTSYYREKESSVFIDPSVTDEMKNKLQHLEDIANEASDEIWDDDKENGTSGILKLCDQLADKIHAYLASANSSELQNTDISSSKNTKSTISIEMPVTIKSLTT